MNMLIPVDTESDFDSVILLPTSYGRLVPHCKKHGAMNKITPEGIWRCIHITGYREKRQGNSIAHVHQETICRTACFQLKESQI